MKKIYVVIGCSEDMAGIDEDCVFAKESDAKNKCIELGKEFPDQFFNVEEIKIPEDI